MNFKFTKAKVIWSLVIGLILGYLYIMNLGNLRLFNPLNYIAGMPLWIMLLIYALPIFLVYIIWSLFQGRK
jgi:hypothetical protein